MRLPVLKGRMKGKVLLSLANSNDNDNDNNVVRYPSQSYYPLVRLRPLILFLQFNPILRLLHLRVGEEGAGYLGGWVHYRSIM
jgi:hypothetical protein